ncbi:hypothetical protein P3T36_002909 [Kitasatospora sp. MAP12-15]|uniref:alpha/beta hydrolase n=1 Tax=unclassified Kitasatospora TaxID=2633591 RepID=UPI0024737E99|nr:alpha/beta hydrolase-fold protein [Kitasatospora sp. MAP12-44]MDH6114088.1 hypothetical protein [Kitasatospora sp. MAP12-44]
MGLTSHKVLALAILVALSAMAGTVRIWPRLARQGWQAVLGRIAALLATQLTLLVALGLLANNYFAFYGSWDELLGGGDTSPVTVQSKLPTSADLAGIGADSRRSGGGSGGRGSGGRPIPVQPLGREDVQGGGAVGREPAQAGQIDAVRITGAQSGLTTDAYVYLPPQYFQPAYANRKFPAVVVMTGFPGDARNLVTGLNYPGTALGLNLSGKMQPTVLVLMRPSPAMPRDTECEDVPGGPPSDAYFSQDVPKVIAASYRVIPDGRGWGVMGDSTGGYCALKLAMRHPEVFPTAVSLSGYYKAAEDDTTGDLFAGSQQLRDQADLVWRLKNLPAPAVSVLVAGTKQGDGDYRQQTDRFVAAVQGPMTISYSMLEAGGHNLQTWSRLMPSSLEWLSQHLAPPS